MKWIKITLGLLLGVGLAIWITCRAGRMPVLPPVRAVWVTRFDYKTPDDVQRIVENVARTGFTDLFFQIRGNGTVFYRSELEPWASELSGLSVALLGTDPGWDPLQVAIDSARMHGLRIHAYMNVLPGWRGLVDPPASAGQLWTSHPDWFMVDSLGSIMRPTTGWYTFLNPVLPEVRAHLRGIVRELCSYDVDGIHLDYIRYPEDYRLVAREHYPNATDNELRRRADFSYDPVSQGALMEQYGWDISRENVADFRRESVTRVVREISSVMQLSRSRSCVLSASVQGDLVTGRRHAYQDSGVWAREGIVDWVVQMNYGTKSFSPNLNAMKNAAGRRGFHRSVVVGLYGENEGAALEDQLEEVMRSGCRGFAFFSYSYLYDKTHQETEKGRMLRERIRPLL